MMEIRSDDLRGPEIARLIREHLQGVAAAFAPAHSVYAQFGFRPCAPFADYVEDPNSVFMTKEL
jgi:hypothetical protein